MTCPPDGEVKSPCPTLAHLTGKMDGVSVLLKKNSEESERIDDALSARIDELKREMGEMWKAIDKVNDRISAALLSALAIIAAVAGFLIEKFVLK